MNQMNGVDVDWVTQPNGVNQITDETPKSKNLYIYFFRSFTFIYKK